MLSLKFLSMVVIGLSKDPGSNVILGSFTARNATVVSVSHAFYLPYAKA